VTAELQAFAAQDAVLVTNDDLPVFGHPVRKRYDAFPQALIAADTFCVVCHNNTGSDQFSSLHII